MRGYDLTSSASRYTKNLSSLKYREASKRMSRTATTSCKLIPSPTGQTRSSPWPPGVHSTQSASIGTNSFTYSGASVRHGVAKISTSPISDILRMTILEFQNRNIITTQ